MARVTVEDCLEMVENRFQLVLVATKRARQLANGVVPLVDWENDKPTIVALREIAEGLIDASILTEPLYPDLTEDEPEEEAAVEETAAAAAAEETAAAAAAEETAAAAAAEETAAAAAAKETAAAAEEVPATAAASEADETAASEEAAPKNDD